MMMIKKDQLFFFFSQFHSLLQTMTELSSKSATVLPVRYSNDNLIKLYGMDIFAAISSSAMVSPFIAIVDR